MHADLQLHDRVLRHAALSPAAAFAAVTTILVAVFALHAPTTASMIDIWRRSETFTHGFLVVPAVLAFVWLRRAELARTPIRPSRTALLAVAAAGALWLIGELSSSLAPAQFGMVAMVPAAVAAIFGWAWVRALAFPLAFLFFAVPFGEVFVPTLIEWTADFTIAALRASGVPVYRESTSFVIPSGRWSVVEACSGIRYLIASVMLGSLYAWLMYRSPRRRTLFVAASIVVPLVANWLRAYGIVMLGHLSNNRIATGVDHLIYGWIFFGVLMLAMFWVGARWREDGAIDARVVAEEAAAPDSAAPTRTSLMTSIMLLAVVLLAWPVANAALTRVADSRPVAAIEIASANGWSPVSVDLPGGWRPDVHGAARTQVLGFAKDGRQVEVVISMFRNQRQGAELVSATNQLVHQDNERWRIVERRTIELADPVGRFDARAALVRGSSVQFAAAHWYWLGQRRTASDAAAKIDLALDRLLLRGDTSAWVVIAVPARENLRDAVPELESFVRDMGAAINTGLTEAASR